MFGLSKRTTAALLVAAVTVLSFQLYVKFRSDGNPEDPPVTRIPAHVLPMPKAASTQLQDAIARSLEAPPADGPPLPSPTDDWRPFITNVNRGGLEFTASAGSKFPDVQIVQSNIDGVATYTLIPGPIVQDNRNKLLIHFHGGAYVLFGGKAGLGEAIEMAHYTGMEVISVDYGMPPDHPFPSALDDAVTVWRYVLKSHSPASVGFGGTSAGGGLTLAVVLRLKELGLPLPGALFCGTPWADLKFQSDSLNVNEFVDDVLPTREGFLTAAAQLYAGSNDRANPLISPIYGDFRNFPPTILVSGTRDLLLSDTVRVHRKLRHAGVDAELHVFEGLSHAEYLSLLDSPESIDAWTEIAKFFDSHLSPQ